MGCRGGFTGHSASSFICTYNLGYLNESTYGENVTTDETDYDGINPYFISTSEGNFRLMSMQEGYPVHSPCIDLGDPTDDYSLEPTPNGSRINMGAYGNTRQAELSYVPTTTSTTTTTTTTTSTTSTTALPRGIIVLYPVMWKPRTDPPVKMAYSLTTDQATRLVIYSISGEIVLNSSYASGTNGGRAGYNEVTWDGKTAGGNTIGNGVYVVQLVSGSQRIAKGYLTILQ
jgi:hypothetical protein